MRSAIPRCGCGKLAMYAKTGSSPSAAFAALAARLALASVSSGTVMAILWVVIPSILPTHDERHNIDQAATGSLSYSCRTGSRLRQLVQRQAAVFSQRLKVPVVRQHGQSMLECYGGD